MFEDRLENIPFIMHGEDSLDSAYRKVHVSYFSSQLHANPYRRRISSHITSSISFEVILL